MGDTPPRPAKTADISKLIRLLGDDVFESREAAQRKLEAIGEPALDALRKAALGSDDVELKTRAKQLIQSITAKEVGAEAAKLQGLWRLVYVGKRGNGMSVGNDTFEIAFSGKQYTWKGSGFLSFVDTNGPFVLGQLRGTKTIDLHANQRPPRFAVYAVEDDVLEICLDITQERHRPEKLEPGNSRQLLLLTFQREER